MTVHDWLEAYGKSHQNPVNKTIHWICVPAITVTLVALLSLLKLPGSPVNGAHVFLGLALVFYFRLSITLGWGMLLVTALTLLAVAGLALLPVPLAVTSVVLFVLAWLGQFIGHKIEGKKPSFFQDVQFLLIGPLWLTAHLYDRWGIKY